MTNTVIHKAETRGLANHGWLNSRHTFSFAQYFDPKRIHFGALRVLNDDIVQGGMGFGKHPHDNMEIISIPLKGSLEHQDSTGNKEVIQTGEVQIMSAGSGLYHSEYNHSKSEDVNFLQIWVFPKQKNIQPRYEQKKYDFESKRDELINVVAPDNKEALWINQNAWFSMGNISKGKSLEYSLKKKGNGVYIFLIEGAASANNISLEKRDGLGLTNVDKVSFDFNEDSTVLIMEVPMEFEN